MKIKLQILFFLLVFGINHASGQKKYLEKNIFDSTISGEALIKSSYIIIKNDTAIKEFEIDIKEDGEYYFYAWILGSLNTGTKRLNDFDLIVNGNIINKLSIEKQSWHCAVLKDRSDNKKIKLKLNSGINFISFLSKIPNVPEVDFIRLNKNEVDTALIQKKYNDYIKNLKDIKNVDNSDIKLDSTNLLKSYYNPPFSSDPVFLYDYHLNINFSFTFYTNKYYNTGNQINITSYGINNFQHVIEVFSRTNPINYSYIAYSNNGVASLNVNCQYADDYYIRIRAFNPSSGLVNAYINGDYYSNCPATLTRYVYPHTPSEYLNYFTCFLSGDSRIWLEGSNGNIIAYNDDYSGVGNFYWGVSSRVLAQLPSFLSAMVSSYSSYNPTGTCDLYIACIQANDVGGNVCQEIDDIMVAGFRVEPPEYDYGCTDWAGGVTVNVDPTHPSSIYYAGNLLASFDNFYGNMSFFGMSAPRYSGAMTYTNSGATQTNSILDLYYRLEGGQYFPSHAQIKKPANNYPHGYDWESKNHYDRRVFHTRFDFCVGGSVRYYISQQSLKSSNLLLIQTIAENKTVILYPHLSSFEKTLLDSLRNKLSKKELLLLEEKYNNWKKSWKRTYLSNPITWRQFSDNNEYKELLEVCEKLKKNCWPFIFSKFDEGDKYAMNIIDDLTSKDFNYLLDETKREYLANQYDSLGRHIFPSNELIYTRYIKKLLNHEFHFKSERTSDNDLQSNVFEFKVFPNPANYNSNIFLSLLSGSEIRICLYDMRGQEMANIVSNKYYKEGEHVIPLNIQVPNGTYLLGLYINGVVNVKKINFYEN